jgi:hypothetical protein
MDGDGEPFRLPLPESYPILDVESRTGQMNIQGVSNFDQVSDSC